MLLSVSLGAMTMTNNNSTPTTVSTDSTVSSAFRDWEDLQTRLLLLPRIEETGVGAVVEQYRAQDEDAKQIEDEQAAIQKGAVLIGLVVTMNDHKQEDISLKDLDFATILSKLREATTPIVLQFEITQQQQPPKSPPHINRPYLHEEEKKTDSPSRDDDDQADTQQPKESAEKIDATTTTSSAEAPANKGETGTNEEDSNEKIQKQTPEMNKPEVNSPSKQEDSTTDTIKKAETTALSTSTLITPARAHSFMNWASRLGATAAEKATASATRLTATAAVASAVASASIAGSSDNGKQTLESSSPTPLQLFVQNSLGAYLPVSPPKTNQTKKSSEGITNSTLLTVRVSVTEACPANRYTFQWYKWAPAEKTQQQSPPTAMQEWILLDNATLPSFQPSALEVGYYVRCLCQKLPQSSIMAQDDEEVDFSAGNHDQSPSEQDPPFVLDTNECVSATLSLFNGARQALAVRGGQFGGLLGRENAQGREFRIQVAVVAGHQSENNNNKTTKVTTCGVNISQVVNGTAESLTPEGPIPFTTAALVDYQQSKQLVLKFQKDLPESACMLRALCCEDGTFPLTASSRMGRESLLLSIGIASFTKKPAELDTKTVLYKSTVPLTVESESSSEQQEPEKASAEAEESTSQSDLASSDRDGAIPNSTLTPPRPPLNVPNQGTPRSSVPSSPRTNALPSPSRIPKPSSGSSSRRCNSFDASSMNHAAVEGSRLVELEKEVLFLRAKLSRKEKSWSQQLDKSHAEKKDTQVELDSTKKDLKDTKMALRLAEKRVETQDDCLKRLKKDKTLQAESLEEKLALERERSKQLESTISTLQSERDSFHSKMGRVSDLEKDVSNSAHTIKELEKATKTLQNEKAILQAGIEARESKLTKMAELQTMVDSLQIRVKEGELLQSKLDESNKRHQELVHQVQAARRLVDEQKVQIQQHEVRAHELEKSLQEEHQRATSCRSEFETQQLSIQKLKAERNSYKQKGDSLAKEIAKVCRNGLTIKDVQKILADDASRRQEVVLLREQKRKALDELKQYRTQEYVQSQAVTQLDPNQTDHRLLQRNVELERLLSEMTEYVSAKEMQLETLRQVNEALQAELSKQAALQMSKHLHGKGDV